MRIENPRKWILIGLAALFASYFLFQARFLVLGPRVRVLTPQDGMRLESEVVMVEGRAHNVAWLTLNDRQIFTNEDGRFSEKLIVGEGASIITLRGKDRFGREVERRITIFK